MPTSCDHSESERYISSQGYSRCRVCDRIRNRKARGNPDSSVEVKKPGSVPFSGTIKICSSCDAKKPLDSFYKSDKGPGGRQSICVECWKERYNQPAVIRASHLRRKYGITPQQYDKLLADQDGVCWICGASPETQPNGILPVDHCHRTKEVRGLLCGSCNNGLGRFKDDINLLEAAIAYLEKSPPRLN